MKQMSSADFRKSYSSEVEPVEVTSYSKRIGVWYPEGCVPEGVAQPPAEDAGSAAPAKARFSIRPVKESKRPALVAKEVRVVDTSDERARERARWASIGPRLSQSSTRQGGRG